jgi:hypothetical protein
VRTPAPEPVLTLTVWNLAWKSWCTWRWQPANHVDVEPLVVLARALHCERDSWPCPQVGFWRPFHAKSSGQRERLIPNCIMSHQEASTVRRTGSHCQSKI